MSDTSIEIFYDIHQGLPRKSPGDAESTKKAFLKMVNLPPQPIILDIGCGSGSQTLILARLTKGRIVAVDNHQPFLNEFEEKVRHEGLSDRIQVIKADMLALEFQKAAFDVIWAEGSIYIIGFERGLKAWKPLVKKGGWLAVSEVTWLKLTPPREIKEFWNELYPSMQDVESNLKIIRDCGYTIIDYFALPESAWWSEYYNPLEKRLKVFRNRYASDAEILAIIEIAQAEIDLYRKYSDYYGYVFYIVQAS